MSYTDVAILAVVMLFGLLGLRNGMFREMFGLIGIVVGIYFGSRYSLEMGDIFSKNVINFNNSSVASVIGFLIIAFSVWLVCSVLGVVFGRLSFWGPVKVLDYGFGYIFACTKYFLILSFIVYAMSELGLLKSILNSGKLPEPHLHNIMIKISRVAFNVGNEEIDFEEDIRGIKDAISPSRGKGPAASSSGLKEERVTPSSNGSGFLSSPDGGGATGSKGAN